MTQNILYWLILRGWLTPAAWWVPPVAMAAVAAVTAALTRKT